MSEKNQAFHRLAEKRVESIADALRIFSNLSGPSYEWSPDEVMAYIRQIDEAKHAMLARFIETKRWQTTGAPDPDEDEDDDGEDQIIDETEKWESKISDEPVLAASKQQKRAGLITEILAGQDDREALAEMVAMQREVIERLQAELDQRRKP